MATGVTCSSTMSNFLTSTSNVAEMGIKDENEYTLVSSKPKQC